ncbi:hypothetical protein LOK49_LG12G02840 [Camellia lanceoleosa]|uniref:Uncharacterized protein n=1 Tax=Camellia lanceoleosa TaxID=1840588 RepID=A0ACC0FQC8_9ERIC|nr:hypothetical protein LOK49_LG12G02840 [Camellia lanceoleosa]
MGGVEGGSELGDSDGWLQAKGKGDWRWLWWNVKLNRKGWITIGYGQGGVEEDNQILIVHECYGVEKFEISSIDLATFEYIGKVKNFSFLDVPRLEKVHIRFMVAYERGTQYMFNGIANDLPRLQTLSLVLTTDEVLPITARITRFNSLKQLELFVMVSSDFNLLSLTLLLNASSLL